MYLYIYAFTYLYIYIFMYLYIYTFTYLYIYVFIYFGNNYCVLNICFFIPPQVDA